MKCVEYECARDLIAEIKRRVIEAAIDHLESKGMKVAARELRTEFKCGGGCK